MILKLFIPGCMIIVIVTSFRIKPIKLYGLIATVYRIICLLYRVESTADNSHMLIAIEINIAFSNNSDSGGRGGSSSKFSRN